ncbi:MAG: hypothetical protein WCF04_05450 [Candidatus Nanopelagicales bacterium]
MGKALYGFQGGPDPRLLAELAMLRARVRTLEAQVALLRAAGQEPPAAGELGLELLTSSDPALV